MKKIRRYLPFLLFGLLAFWAAKPLFGSGFIPTHDAEYHLIRLWQFDKNIRSGILFPRWAPDLDHGFGVPLFSFFYPFPNYAAELFRLIGFDLIKSLKLSQALAFILSGLFFYGWIEKKWSSWPALIGSVFYLYAPYHFVDLYVRGSVGEVWALVWLPALLWAIEINRPVLTALFFALLILSHNILALIFTPFLLVWILVIRKHKVFLALVVGLALSAYFWLPALAESRWVTGLELIDFSDHFPSLDQLIFPSWGTGFSVPGILDGMSFQIGFDHLAVVMISILILWKRPRFQREIVFALVCFLLSVSLCLEISLPIWRLLPLMKYIQYPWRLLSLIILLTSFMAGWLGARFKKIILIFSMLALAVLINYRYSRPVIYLPRSDTFYLDNPDWTTGTATLGNSFNTIKAQEHQNFGKKLVVLEGETEIEENFIKPTSYSFLVEADKESKLRVNTNWFPGWQVEVDHKTVSIGLEQDGAFNFVLPSGEHLVEIKLKETNLRFWADLVSLLSFIFLLVVIKLRQAKK